MHLDSYQELLRRDALLRDALFQKDQRLMQLELAHRAADRVNRTLCWVLGATLLGFVCLSLWAINVVGRV